MEYLQGDYKSKLDDKGRMNIPSAFRDILGETFYIAESVDADCITVYPADEWNKTLEKLDKDENNMQMSLIRRFLIGSSRAVTMDKQGRIPIPYNLREHASIYTEEDTKKDIFEAPEGIKSYDDIIVMGVGRTCEIWNREAYMHHKKKTRDALREAIAKFNL